MENTAQKSLFLFLTFFKGMMFAFTNGAAALPTVERGIVDKKHWLTHEEFWTYPVLAQTLPGVISIHNAILIGNRIAGPWGAVAALVGVILPAFVCMLGIAALFQTLSENQYIQGAIRGIRVISIAIILGNAVKILRNVPRQGFTVILILLTILIPLFSDIRAFTTILACGAAGIISVLIAPSVLEQSDASPKEDEK
ncbi:MAG: chromate transporter [Anaerolineaceae bacterium]|nr:chromate transporter [Anaerolineaceae bacterium]